MDHRIKRFIAEIEPIDKLRNREHHEFDLYKSLEHLRQSTPPRTIVVYAKRLIGMKVMYVCRNAKGEPLVS